MPRHLKDQFDTLAYYNHRLPAVKARIKADIECAKARGDLIRAHRYAMRLYLVEGRYRTTAPLRISYSDFD
jgi:hypothetical protein